MRKCMEAITERLMVDENKETMCVDDIDTHLMSRFMTPDEDTIRISVRTDVYRSF